MMQNRHYAIHHNITHAVRIRGHWANVQAPRHHHKLWSEQYPHDGSRSRSNWNRPRPETRKEERREARVSKEPKYFNIRDRVILNDDDRRPIRQEQDGCIKAASILILSLGIIAYMCL